MMGITQPTEGDETMSDVNLMAERRVIGEFDVDGQWIHVTDPAFDVSTMGVVIRDARAGKWKTALYISDRIPGWGRRPTRLVAWTNGDEPNSWEIVGEAGVDSATICIAQAGHAGERAEDREDRGSGFYDHVGAHRVECMSGFGDGGYNVFQAVVDGKVVGVMVELITPETAAQHATER